MAGCGAASDITASVQDKQAFEIYVVGQYSLFECSDSLAGTMNISSAEFRFTETLCDLSLNGISKTPFGPQVKLTNCRSDGGVEPNKTVVFEPTDEGVNLHGYDKTVRSFKKCPILKN